MKKELSPGRLTAFCSLFLIAAGIRETEATTKGLSQIVTSKCN
jgi:hypothetical protein